MPRRIYTDGRDFPTDDEPSFMGYSIGKWIDTDGDGRYDTLEVETRNFKGPRTVRNQRHSAAPTTTRPSSRSGSLSTRPIPNVLHNEITIIDHALTRPWTVTSAIAATATSSGTRTIAPRTTTTSSSARRTIS